MAEQQSMVDLLKYPVTVFAILIAVIIAKFALGITFGSVTEITGEGIKFSQDAKGELTDLASKLNGALAAIDELKKQAPAAEANPQARVAEFTASQTVPDQSAQIASIASPATSASARQGYIWIGNYKGGWNPTMLAALATGQPITAAPDTLVSGAEYKVLGNIVVRDGLPGNDAAYYQGHKSLGSIPRGTTIRLVTPPTGLDRQFAVQYWAKVELP